MTKMWNHRRRLGYLLLALAFLAFEIQVWTRTNTPAHAILEPCPVLPGEPNLDTETGWETGGIDLENLAVRITRFDGNGGGTTVTLPITRSDCLAKNAIEGDAGGNDCPPPPAFCRPTLTWNDVVGDWLQTVTAKNDRDCQAYRKYLAGTAIPVEDFDLSALQVYVDLTCDKTLRVSQQGTGPGSGYSRTNHLEAISTRGRFVVFSTSAPIAMPVDYDDVTDIYVKNMDDASVKLVSITNDWRDGQIMDDAAITPDGRFVAFDCAGICVRDLELKTTEIAPNTASPSGDPSLSISADGSKVAFVGFWRGDYSRQDAFIWDRSSATVYGASVAHDGGSPNGHSSRTEISADGKSLAFESSANNLVTGDTNGKKDVFVRHLDSLITERVSVGAGGIQSDGASSDPSISADGTSIAFVSEANNLGWAHIGTSTTVYVRDLPTTSTALASVTSSGFPVHSDEPSISADGRYVAFKSYDAMDNSDVNMKNDIYVRDRLKNMTIFASISSQSVPGDNNSSAPEISPEGEFVAFDSSSANLVVTTDPLNALVGHVYRRQLF